MADIKISELNSVASLNNGDLVEVSQENALAPSGYTSLKASMTDLGKKVNTDIDYTTDLADFTDKTIAGAIKETAKDKNVADEYDDTQTYDKGDVVIYKNTLYICTTNNTTGTWDATKWTATTVQSLIGDLSSLTTTDKSSIVGAVNEVNAASSDSSITFTPADATKVSLTSLTAYRNGAVLILNLYLTANTTITANSELQLGTFSGTNASLGAISGAVVNRSNSGLLGSYCFTTGNQRIYANMNSNVASGTNFYLTIVTFT